MAETVGDFLLERLAAWGTKQVYGFPGDGINGLLGSFSRQKEVEFIQVRHEEMAAFMACAHAKWTGQVGVCMATSGPGAIHLLNGLYDAKLDHQPVVAIVGDAYTRAQGGHDQQEVDLLNLFKDVAADYVIRCNAPSALRHQIDRAMRIAMAYRTVTCVIVPADIQEEKAQKQQPHLIHTIHSGLGYSPARVIPQEQDLQRAADVLNAGRKVAMLVGAGALEATDEVIAAADLLGAGVAKALLGKAAVPDDVPYCTNSIGLLGTKPSWDMMMGCDTLFLVGTSFPYANFLPAEGKARGVQIELEPRMANLKYPCEVALIGDSKETLKALIPLLKRQQDRSWQEGIVKGVEDWRHLMEERGQPQMNPDGKLKPQGLFAVMSEKIPDNAIVSSDSGSAANWYARHLRVRRGMKCSLSGNLATMLPGVPYAVAAKFAFPDRVAIATVGDGAMQMLGMNELITAAKFYRSWSDPRLVVLVLNNQDLNQVTWEQRVFAGDPKFQGSQDVPYMDFAKYAESIGLKGIRVEQPEQIAPAWEAALAGDRPVVIDAIVDPNEPPMPPHITFKQARELATAMAKGDEDRTDVMRTAIKDKVDEFLPGR